MPNTHFTVKVDFSEEFKLRLEDLRAEMRATTEALFCSSSTAHLGEPLGIKDLQSTHVKKRVKKRLEKRVVEATLPKRAIRFGGA